jgi:hypothetical protein
VGKARRSFGTGESYALDVLAILALDGGEEAERKKLFGVPRSGSNQRGRRGLFWLWWVEVSAQVPCLSKSRIVPHVASALPNICLVICLLRLRVEKLPCVARVSSHIISWAQIVVEVRSLNIVIIFMTLMNFMRFCVV